MDWKTGTYVVYLVLSIGLTIWVARTLSRNGTVFLVLLVVGILHLFNVYLLSRLRGSRVSAADPR